MTNADMAALLFRYTTPTVPENPADQWRRWTPEFFAEFRHIPSGADANAASGVMECLICCGYASTHQRRSDILSATGAWRDFYVYRLTDGRSWADLEGVLDAMETADAMKTVMEAEEKTGPMFSGKAFISKGFAQAIRDAQASKAKP